MKQDKQLFVYLPLCVLAGFFALMLVPHSIIVPWRYLNIWTVLQALSSAYMLLGVLAFCLKRQDLGRAILVVGFSIFCLGLIFNFMGFGGLGYMLIVKHVVAFMVILLASVIAGTRILLSGK